MPDVQLSYLNLKPRLAALELTVKSAIGRYAEENGYLVTSRIKTWPSILDKLETGRFRSLDEIDDLLALTIIIDTRAQEREALNFISRTFDIKEIRGKTTLKDERMFDFDATRVYATLKSSIENPLSNYKFEIQIRTLLPHAWSKITHPLVYKGRQVDSRQIRLAAEILAHIEGLDRNFSTFATVARGVKRVERTRTTQLNRIVKLVDDLESVLN